MCLGSRNPLLLLSPLFVHPHETAGLIAHLPFSASAHVSKPSDKKADASIFRIVELSSTTKTVFPAPRFLGSLSISTGCSSFQSSLAKEESNHRLRDSITLACLFSNDSVIDALGFFISGAAHLRIALQSRATPPALRMDRPRFFSAAQLQVIHLNYLAGNTTQIVSASFTHCSNGFAASFVFIPVLHCSYLGNIFSHLFALELRGVDKNGRQPIGRPSREFPLSKWKWRRQGCAPRCGWGSLPRFSANAGCSHGRTPRRRVPTFRNR